MHMLYKTFTIVASFQDNRNDTNKTTNLQYCECSFRGKTCIPVTVAFIGRFSREIKEPVIVGTSARLVCQKSLPTFSAKDAMF